MFFIFFIHGFSMFYLISNHKNIFKQSTAGSISLPVAISKPCGVAVTGTSTPSVKGPRGPRWSSSEKYSTSDSTKAPEPGHSTKTASQQIPQNCQLVEKGCLLKASIQEFSTSNNNHWKAMKRTQKICKPLPTAVFVCFSAVSLWGGYTAV